MRQEREAREAAWRERVNAPPDVPAFSKGWPKTEEWAGTSGEWIPVPSSSSRALSLPQEEEEESVGDTETSVEEARVETTTLPISRQAETATSAPRSYEATVENAKLQALIEFMQPELYGYVKVADISSLRSLTQELVTAHALVGEALALVLDAVRALDTTSGDK